MKTKLFIFILLLITLAIAFFTNPDKEVHKEAIIVRSNQVIEEAIAERNDMVSSVAWQLTGKQFLSEFIDSNVTIEDYYLFSIQKVSWDGKSYPMGVGAFGKVYVSKHLNRDVVLPILNDMENKVKEEFPDFL